MTPVHAFTAERMLEIEQSAIISGAVLLDHLQLTRRDGTTIDAGYVKGDPGTPGTPGASAAITGATATGLPAGAAPTVNVGGTSLARTFAFGIPKGDSGDPGAPGTPGTSATITGATATGLAAGAAPTVNLGGTSSARTFAFGIPKGDPGVAGADGSSAVPAGTISLWGFDTPPSNWLICDGSAVSRTTYASLFAVIGTKYGVGDGSTTFNLPNLKGKTPVGFDSTQTEFNALGKTGGTKTHSHQHMYPLGMTGSAIYAINPYGGSMDQVGHVDFYSIVSNHTAQSLGAGSVNPALETHVVTSSDSGTIQPYLTVNFIIKVTNGDTPGDSQLTTRVSALESGTSYSQSVRNKIARVQRALNGGGIRRVASDGIGWGARFIAIGIGYDSLALDGYFNIDMPPNGTVIPVHAHPTKTSVTIANGKIPMTDFCTLYYDVPIGSLSAMVPANFHIVYYKGAESGGTTSQFSIPDTWVKICTKNNDATSPGYMWGDGRSQDYWRALTLLNAWTNFGSGYSLAGWRISDNGEILLRGLIKSGTGVIISTLTGYAPEQTSIFVQQAGPGVVRIDVDTSANIQTPAGYMAGGNNTFVSLEGIRWFPNGA